ncbi:MAG: hypothetical protein HYZ68_00250 [Chloroflexi bacterium]|nr:hypothetical protein [Chloroflexota bacterium]
MKVISVNQDPKEGCVAVVEYEGQETINDITYDVYGGSEGAAGSFYEDFCYITTRNQKYFVLEFVVRTVNCGVYYGTENWEPCNQEIEKADPKKGIEQIVSTFRFLHW